MFYTMKRVFVFLIVIVVLLAAIGCSNEKSSARDNTADAKKALEVELPKDYSLLVEGIPGDVGSLHPFSGNTRAKDFVQRVVFERLADYDGYGGKMIGVLARDITKIDDVTYETTLYDYIKDSLGNPVTAADIVWCYKTAIAAKRVNFLRYVESVDQIDDLTIRFVLNSTRLGMIEQVLQSVPIVSKAAADDLGEKMSTNPVTTSAYIVTDYTSGSSIAVEKNKNYWQKDDLRVTTSMSNFDRIEFKVIPEPAQMSIALETGTIDLAGGLSATEAARFDSDPIFKVHKVTNSTFDVITFTCRDGSPTRDINLRKAILYAIDPTAILKGVYNGEGVVSKNFCSALSPDYIEKWNSESYYEYDLENAKQFIKKSSYNGEELSLVALNSANYKRTAELIQAELLQIGVKTKLMIFDEALFETTKRDPAQYDIHVGSSGGNQYAIQAAGYWFNADNYTTHKALAGWDDQKLLQLYRVANDAVTFSPESVDAFFQYAKEQAYGIALVATYYYYVTPANMGIKTDNRFSLASGACFFQ